MGANPHIVPYRKQELLNLQEKGLLRSIPQCGTLSETDRRPERNPQLANLCGPTWTRKLAVRLEAMV
jgi:hypothetical protein